LADCETPRKGTSAQWDRGICIRNISCVRSAVLGFNSKPPVVRGVEVMVPEPAESLDRMNEYLVPHSHCMLQVTPTSPPTFPFRRLFDSNSPVEQVQAVKIGDHIEDVVGKGKLLGVGRTESAVGPA
jgi:hypothetical protein